MSIIRVQGVSKIFRQKQGKKLLKDQVKAAVSRRREGGFYALNKVSFTVEHGESVALIGANGAGKSTMLALLCGLAQPDEGSVAVDGPVAALLELASGFHPDLTGRENVMLNAAFLGLNRKRAPERFGSILEFSELAEFIDQPLRTYSTGMILRLGFAVAVHCDPELVIVDELLAVGDAAFQAKCLDRILQIRHAGKALLLVTHSPAMALQLCDRAIWLHQGELIMDGKAAEVLEAYMEFLKRPAGLPEAAQAPASGGEAPRDFAGRADSRTAG